jgi:aminopeptidase YwaD
MRRQTILIAIIISLAACTGTGRRNAEVTTKELREHISYLASDELKGRMTGTEGDSLAAEYIRKELISYGLEPLVGDGFQRFSVTSDIVASPGNQMAVNGKELVAGSDFMPLSITENGTVEAEVIFAGYGFMIDSDTLKWNDYAELDVSGKWVMVLRADPEVDNNSSNFAAISSDRNKAMIARDMGAAGIILVSGTRYDPNDTFEALKNAEFSAGIPAVRIRREVASQILGGRGSTIEEIETIINQNRKPAGFSTGVMVKATAEVERRMSGTRNVVLYLPGKDPLFKDEFLIFGAHYDHLGMGGEGSSSRAVDTIATALWGR